MALTVEQRRMALVVAKVGDRIRPYSADAGAVGGGGSGVTDEWWCWLVWPGDAVLHVLHGAGVAVPPRHPGRKVMMMTGHDDSGDDNDHETLSEVMMLYCMWMVRWTYYYGAVSYGSEVRGSSHAPNLCRMPSRPCPPEGRDSLWHPPLTIIICQAASQS